MHTRRNFCMFYWSGKNGNKSGKSQEILISCVSGNPGCFFSELMRNIVIMHI